MTGTEWHQKGAKKPEKLGSGGRGSHFPTLRTRGKK